jgi:high-affinity nickel-transport protein
MTRRLIASGSRPVTVGMWFSLGHSTIVVVTCIVVAATSGALEKRFDGFERVGNIVGTAVSAGVLILLGVGNAWILLKLVQKLRELLNKDVDEDALTFRADGGFNLEGGGLLVRLLKKVFKVIDRPWKMYFVGVMFGLGFDTSSEIAVIGIASVQGAEGTSIWLILIFPVLFTGMNQRSQLLRGGEGEGSPSPSPSPSPNTLASRIARLGNPAVLLLVVPSHRPSSSSSLSLGLRP